MELIEPWPATGTQRHKCSIKSWLNVLCSNFWHFIVFKCLKQNIQVPSSMQRRYSHLCRKIRFTVPWRSENIMVPPNMTYFNGIDSAHAGVLCPIPHHTPPRLWHLFKFILITIETKDKFPTAALKQLHLWLFFVKCKEGRSVMWDLNDWVLLLEGYPRGFVSFKVIYFWQCRGFSRRIPVIISWTQCFKRVATSSRS